MWLPHDFGATRIQVIIHQPSQVTFEQASATLGPEWMADVAGVNQV